MRYQLQQSDIGKNYLVLTKKYSADIGKLIGTIKLSDVGRRITLRPETNVFKIESHDQRDQAVKDGRNV